MRGDGQLDHASLRAYLEVLRRRRWLVVQAVVLVPIVAVVISLQQQKQYEAQAQVLLSAQNLAAQLTNTQSTGINLQPDRIAATQADVARVPTIAKRVVEQVPDAHLTADGFLSSSGVSTATNADLLTFSVTNHDPLLARRLVDAYARNYTIYRRQLDTSAIKSALRSVNSRIAQLVDGGGRGGALYASLVDRQQTLATMEALQTSNATVVKEADKAVQVQPKPTRNGILGLLLGVVLGVGLAFLWEALDTRVRREEEISERLGVPLLARLPEPSRRLRSKDWLAMIAEPTGTSAESFRMLRTNLEFALLDRHVKSLMVTSAVEREGKSTTIANLAVALARSGKKVVLVDLDLRRPYLHRFFDLHSPGLTSVALGRVHLSEALTPVAIAGAGAPRTTAANGNGNGSGNGSGRNGSNGLGGIHGMLEVLPCGPIPPDPGEFVGRRAVQEILERLAERADIVLVDAPPVLHVGDALTLSSSVDAMLVVTRMNLVRRNMLNELSRALARTPVPTIGFVATAAQEESDGYGYAYGYGYGYASSYAPQADTIEERVER